MELSLSNISKVFAIISISVSLLLYLQVVDPYQLYFNKDLIIKNHEYWRILTSIFNFGPLGFRAIINIFFFLRNTSNVEGSYFSGRPLDFLLFTSFGVIMFFLYAIKKPTLFFGDMLVSYFMYYDSKKSPDNQVFLFFGVPFPVQHAYVPFAFILLNFMNASSMKSDLYAYTIAHIYFFIHDVLNLKYDLSLLYMPDRANRMFMKLFE